MKGLRCPFLCAATLFAMQVCVAQAQDAKGCVDSPLVSRFPGSFIVSCTHQEDNAFTFNLAKGAVKKIEGDYREIICRFPQTASGAQVRRNFATALRSAGYPFERDPSDNGRGNFVAHLGKTWISIEFNDDKRICRPVASETRRQ